MREQAGRVGRTIDMQPQPFRLRVDFNLAKITDAIRHAWSVETAAIGTYGRMPGGPYGEFSHATPSRGQCAVTALLVQDIFGGEIVRGVLTRASELVGDGPSAEYLRTAGSHYWNRISNMGDLDLTLAQFPSGIFPTDGVVVERTRLTVGERAEAAYTLRRYYLLRSRFEAELAL